MNTRRKKILFFVLGGIIAGFIFLSILVSAFPTTLLDKEFSEEVQELQMPALEKAMHVVSWFGYMPTSLIVVLVTALVFFLFKFRKEALFTLFTLLSGAVSSSVKILINRPRPTEPFVRIIDKANHQSFPSGHVLFYVVFFGFLILLMNHLRNIPAIIRLPVLVFSAIMVFTVPFSRIYLGAHWFTDVLGGFLLGSLCLAALSFFYFRKGN